MYVKASVQKAALIHISARDPIHAGAARCHPSGQFQHIFPVDHSEFPIPQKISGCFQSLFCPAIRSPAPFAASFAHEAALSSWLSTVSFSCEREIFL